MTLEVRHPDARGRVSRLAAMRAPRTIVALAAVAAVTAVAGCGSSRELPKDIPPTTAQSLLSYLNQVARDCANDPQAIPSAVNGYMNALADVPDSVDSDVRKILDETGTRLQSLARDASGCQEGATATSGLSDSCPPTQPPPRTRRTPPTRR